MATEVLVCVGRVARPHGIRGDLVTDLDLEDPFFLLDAGQVSLFTPRQWQEVEKGRAPGLPTHKLRSLREHKGRVLLQLEGVDDRNAAEELRGRLLCIPEDAFPPLEEGEVYCHDLVGCAALLEDGRFLGNIQEVQFPTPEQEIWAILTADGKEVLLPAHPETVLDIDLAAQTVRIAPPEGLLDLYLGG